MGDDCDNHLSQIQNLKYREGAAVKKFEAVKTYHSSYLSSSKVVNGYTYSFTPTSLNMNFHLDIACADETILDLL